MMDSLHSSSIASPHHDWVSLEIVSSDHVGLEMHLDGLIVRTCRLWSSEFGEALGGHDCANLEIIIEWVGRCTRCPQLIQIGGVHVSDQTPGGRWWRWHNESWVRTHRIAYNLGNVESWLQQHPPRDKRWKVRDWLGVGDSWSWDDGLLGICITWYMQYLVYTVLSVCSIRCMQDVVYALLGVNSWSWHAKIQTDSLTWCSWVMIGWRTRMRKKRGDGEIMIKNVDWRELCVLVNLRFPMQQVWVQRRPVWTPIRVVLNAIRQVIPLISHLSSYPPCRSHHHPPSLLLIHNCTTITEYQVKSSLSISPCHDY